MGIPLEIMKFIATLHGRCSDKGVLIVRTILGVALLMVCFAAHSQATVPPVSKQTERADKAKRSAENNSTDTKKQPTTINLSVSGNLKTNSDETQTEGNKEPVKWTDILLAIFTGLLVAVTAGLIRVGWYQVGTMRTIERAYVKMSPGLLNFLHSDSTGDRLAVNVEIKNFGETPAQVTDVFTKFKILQKGESLPTKPVYIREGPHEPPTAFLVKDDWFIDHYSEAAVNLRTNFVQVRDGVVDLVLFGYVDYVDRFAQPHRAGFARRYDPHFDNEAAYARPEEFKNRSNFVFVAQEGYNYDRPQKKRNKEPPS